MGVKARKPSVPIARIEKEYLDIHGRGTKPEHAVKILTRKYDLKDNLIEATLSFDYRKMY